jgi:L,D-peptidoglycan transpeptidase YkuD (ErfK/YbiS/YcfS/YnhG family)
MQKNLTHRQLFVRALSGKSSRGRLVLGSWSVPCALGQTGRKALKREGDGATPFGRFEIRQAFYRRDRISRPSTAIPLRHLQPNDGWCDAPADRNYNRLVRYPYPASAEQMWRADGLYDLVVVLGHNDAPRIRGLGSAVFLHVARDAYPPTEGCIAIARPHLVRLLGMIGRGMHLATR